MNPRAYHDLSRWPPWGLLLVVGAAVGIVAAEVSYISMGCINPDWWERDLTLLGFAGGALTGAYLGYALHTWIVRPLSVEERDSGEPPPLGAEERQRCRLRAKERLMESWQARAELLEDREARPRTQVGWLIFKPSSGAGKPAKTAAFIRRILNEIRQLNARRRW